MKYKKEIIIFIITIIFILFLKQINVLQIENNLGKPFMLLVLIAVSSIFAIIIQNNIDKNHANKNINYHNIDILKYICAILIIILHLRPFQNYSNNLDLVFNNIITRTCVPIFFLITGYFVGQKEKNNSSYIKEYIKKMIPLYLIWNIIYIPIIIGYALTNMSTIITYINNINVSLYIVIPLLVVLSPLILLIILLYTGFYYHLWYFPAVMLSLFVLDKWKKKFNIKYLLIISFILLLFGATETYYGVIPLSLKQLLDFYYKLFFTTRNFLFFGLFYITLGYFLGTKKEVYTKYCFEKLVFWIFALIFEAIILHDTDRLNSNILLSCVFVSYYLFICTIYLTNNFKINFNFRGLSKYYYLVHPMIIFICTLFTPFNNLNPYIQIIIIILITHFISSLILKIKNKCL